MVLFMMGVFGLLIIYAGQLKDFLRENLQVNVIFYDEAKEADIIRLQKMIENEQYVRQTDYVTKEMARQIMQKELGEDSEAILGFNPFPASLDVYFRSSYATVDSIESFKSRITKYPIVKEVAYQKVLLENLQNYVRFGAIVILTLMIVFLIMAVVLINNTIRLTLYSRRFLIKSMQLVGATQSFIRRPFIIRAVVIGVLGGFIADLLVPALVFLVFRYYAKPNIAPDLKFSDMLDFRVMAFLSLFLLVFGAFISGISSFYSVKRYLRLKLDELY